MSPVCPNLVCLLFWIAWWFVKEGKRIGVSLGLLIGTSLITLYVDKQTNIVTTLIESGVAIAFFLLTPKLVMDRIAKFMPAHRSIRKINNSI